MNDLSQKVSQQPPPVEANIQVYGAHVSTNGSCANTTIKPSGEEPYSDIKLTMWLYVNDDYLSLPAWCHWKKYTRGRQLYTMCIDR